MSFQKRQALYFLAPLLLFNSLSLGSASGILAQPAQDEAAQNESDIRSLESGQVIKRELASGQKHLYRIKLDANQYLKVDIEQEGIDVVVEVQSPDSSPLFKIDSESRLRGREEVILVAESAGEYRLAVLPTQKPASTGSYQIGIAEMRPATKNDLALYEAHKMLDVARKLRDAGQYERALPLFERVIEIRQTVLGPNDSELAYALHSLAVLYYYHGDYLKVETLEKRALAIQEKALGPDHYDIAASLNLLSLLYFYRGDYPKAEQLSIRALAIRQRALGPNHPSLTFYMENLARIYLERGNYAKAEPLYRKALTIREKALAPDHILVAQLLNDLATLYYKKGDDAEAELLNQRALAIREKALGPEHPKVAESLGNLANIYRDRKDYQRAEPLYLRTLAIQEKTLGPLRPHVKSTLDNFAEFYAAKGDIAQAIAVQSRANDVGEYNLSYNIAGGSERQKLAFLDRFSEQTDFTLSLHSLAAPNDPEALKLAFTTLLRRKGRGLDVMTDTIATLRRHATPADQSLFDQLAAARSRLAELSLGEAGGDGTARLQLKKYEDKVENLEAELSTRSVQFRAQTQPVTLKAVQAALPAGSALIEFANYTPRNPRTKESLPPRYLAYLLMPRGQPKWTDLGEAGPINQAVIAWRRALRDPRRLDVKRLARSLDEKIMRPVRASIRSDGPNEIRHLLISPDGLLNLIPFAALVDERRHYLVQRFNISYLTSGRELLRPPATTPCGSDPLVVAFPAFDKDSGTVTRGTDDTGKVTHISKAGRPLGSPPLFQPLPGTEDEALAIKRILPDAVVLLGEEATEAGLKQARGPRILHIATHGFFFRERNVSLDTSKRKIRSLKTSIENPMLRSGLALAGANLGKSGDDDGVLTALEAAGLDLNGTKLVVLSACDTGIGEVGKNGEGVQGMRRALVLAGSESQVISLWQVSDEGTRELMIQYYMALMRGKGRSEGLRQVQLQMLRTRGRRHPFYWASFIQSGEWTDLSNIAAFTTSTQ